MIPITVAIALIALAIGLAVWAVASTAEEKATVRASLRQLDGYEVDSVREQELLKPVKERTVAPLMDRLAAIGSNFSPDGYRDQVRAKMARAGILNPDAPDRFMAARVVGVALAPIVLILVFFVLRLDGLLGLIAAGLGVALCVLGPDVMLDRRIEERQHEIRRALPDVLDLLTISVEAGLGFEQALDRTVAAVPGPLTQEFSRMLGEVRAGSTRANSMRAMEQRCDVAELRSFVLAILQADTFGVSIGRVLRAQADEMRIKRRQYAQERAQKAPVKMLIPMVFCIFPSLFVVIIGPAFISIMDNF